MSPVSMKVNFTVKTERILDLFVGACEGGSNYWCAKIDPLGSEKLGAYEAMLKGFVCFEMDESTGKTRRWKVSAVKIRRALRLFATCEPRHFGDWISENDDAGTADVFLQLCVFGKVIYG